MRETERYIVLKKSWRKAFWKINYSMNYAPNKKLLLLFTNFYLTSRWLVKKKFKAMTNRTETPTVICLAYNCTMNLISP